MGGHYDTPPKCSVFIVPFLLSLFFISPFSVNAADTSDFFTSWDEAVSSLAVESGSYHYEFSDSSSLLAFLLENSIYISFYPSSNRIYFISKSYVPDSNIDISYNIPVTFIYSRSGSSYKYEYNQMLMDSNKVFKLSNGNYAVRFNPNTSSVGTSSSIRVPIWFDSSIATWQYLGYQLTAPDYSIPSAPEQSIWDWMWTDSSDMTWSEWFSDTWNRLHNFFDDDDNTPTPGNSLINQDPVATPTPRVEYVYDSSGNVAYTYYVYPDNSVNNYNTIINNDNSSIFNEGATYDYSADLEDASISYSIDLDNFSKSSAEMNSFVSSQGSSIQEVASLGHGMPTEFLMYISTAIGMLLIAGIIHRMLG